MGPWLDTEDQQRFLHAGLALFDQALDETRGWVQKRHDENQTEEVTNMQKEHVLLESSGRHGHAVERIHMSSTALQKGRNRLDMSSLLFDMSIFALFVLHLSLPPSRSGGD